MGKLVVVLVLEYAITFDREVRFAWGRKLSWARSIFLLNRYLSLLEYLFVLGPLLPVGTPLVSDSRFPHPAGSTLSGRMIRIIGVSFSILWSLAFRLTRFIGVFSCLGQCKSSRFSYMRFGPVRILHKPLWLQRHI